MSDEPLTRCPGCGGLVAPDEPDFVEAVEVEPVEGLGAPSDTSEGLGVLFHAACWRDGDPTYRRLR